VTIQLNTCCDLHEAAWLFETTTKDTAERCKVTAKCIGYTAYGAEGACGRGEVGGAQRARQIKVQMT
jgi:hypothetical protein